MKVKIGEDLHRRDSGKHKFLARLATALESKGVQVVNGKKADVFLHICRNIDEGNECRVKVARVDGLILNRRESYAKQNKKLKSAIKNSHGVIYQGEFCRDAYEKFLGINKTHACILNGADPADFKPRSPENFFLASCKWRPHKRLDAVYDGYLNALDKGVDADLVVVGEVKKVINHPRIRYLGWVGDHKLAALLSKAIATIHLSWLDWCPNAMVESAIAGCPIIYTNSGGSAEVGQNAGISISDVQWNFKIVDLYDPPPLDINAIGDAMVTLKKFEYIVSKPELHIDFVADKYIAFFEKLLG